MFTTNLTATIGLSGEAFCTAIIVHFLVFLKKIFSMVSSCRMMSIPPTRSDDNRRAAGAVVTFHHSDSIMNKQNLQEISGPAARH